MCKLIHLRIILTIFKFLDYDNTLLIYCCDKVFTFTAEKTLHAFHGAVVFLLWHFKDHDYAADICLNVQFLRTIINVNKEQIVKEFVKSMLSERVLAENGEKPRGYSSERTCSRMEYCVRKALEEIAREEVANMVEEQKPALRDLVRKEFQKKNVQGQFVEMFIDSLAGSITNLYSSKISVEFSKKTGY